MIVDRPRREAAVVILGAWLAWMTGLVVGGELEDVWSFVFAAAGGAAFVVLGFAAAWRCRTLSRRATGERSRLLLLSLAFGAVLGLCNLGGNWVIAESDPRLRALLVDHMATVDGLEAVVAAPLIEEVAVRLFLMSAMAWVGFRLTKRATLAFAIALVGSALFFAVLHLGRSFPDDPGLANYYRVALVTKYTLAGLPLGWIFWRWGLPYAILCHAAANAAHLLVQRAVF